MQQLSSLDAQFLAMEDAGGHGNAGFFVVCDPSSAPGGSVTHEDLCVTVAQRIHLAPPYTRKLAEVPLRLDHPYWVEDPAFDIKFHVRESTVEPPGDPRAVGEHVARILAEPLDRSRPLWELHLVHELEHGKIGLLHKFHHALADGISGVEIMDVFVDSDPAGAQVPPRGERAQPPEPPGRLEMLVRGLASAPRQSLRAIRSAPTALPNLADLPGASAIPGAAAIQRLAAPLRRLIDEDVPQPVTDRMQGPPPRTRFNAKLSADRRFAYGTVSLATIKAIRNHSGVTFNDVVVTVCASGLRRWLSELGELPDQPLRALVPVSVRTGEQRRAFGNRISAIVVPLPTEEPDPRRRLERAHRALKAAKQRQRALPPGLLTDAGNFLPPPIFVQASRMTAEIAARVAPPVNLIISNIPGPTEPLYCLGARVEAYHPFTVIMDGVGLNMTAMSYLGGVGFGMVGDHEQLDDLWPVMDAIEASVDELAAAVG
jgi:WS/DGAT/MGAT family acyltransferase